MQSQWDRLKKAKTERTEKQENEAERLKKENEKLKK
jgi:hypothetical protein